MKKQPSKQSSRRKFLQQSAIAGAGAAIVASPTASALSLTETEQEENKKTGYRVTEHVLAYYRSASK
jgi:hypothetical protein